MNGYIMFGRSKVRRELLLRFFARTATKAHVRDLARQIRRTPAAVGRELKLLEGAGILRSSTQGRNLLYEVDTASPIAGELRGLVQRTIGVEAILGEALGLEGVDIAWIIGSYASRKEKPDSDVDVLVVGSPDPEVLRTRVTTASRKLGRDVSLIEITRPEFERLRKRRDPFISDVLSSPKVQLAPVGQEVELSRLATSAAKGRRRAIARPRAPRPAPRARR